MWNQRDNEELEEGKVLVEDTEKNTFELKDAIEIRVVPGKESEGKFLNLTLKIVTFTAKSLIINVTFDYPEYISMHLVSIH